MSLWLNRKLIEAAAKGDTAIVKALLDEGADVTVKDAHNQTPLMWAEKNNHPEIVELLKRYGAREEMGSRRKEE